MRIVLPYVGSKARLFHTLKDNIPQNDLYIEPFSGGFSLGLNLLEKGIVSKTVLNDLDAEVINFWRVVKEDYWGLVSVIDSLITLCSDNLLDQDKIQEQIDSYPKDNITSAAIFYMYRKMNRGLARRRLDPLKLEFGTMIYTQVFQKASSLLSNTTIENKSFEQLLPYDSPSTFWYLDPPYIGAKNENYYTTCKETDFNHEGLRDFCSQLKGLFIQSNHASEEVYTLYKDFYITDIIVPSSQNIKGYTEEVLISNFPISIENTPISKQIKNPKPEVSYTLADMLE